MDYRLKLKQYEGPIQKLLELIEEKKLDITLISLAEVTAGFLEYVRTLKAKAEAEDNLQLVADFLSVASKLILIKSKVLLPFLELEKEEESDIRNLELQVKLYKEFKIAQEHIKDIWHPLPQMASREFLAAVGPVFYPPRSVDAETLHRAFLTFFGEFEKVFKPIEIIKQEMISLKDKLEDVLARVRGGAATFHSLHKGSRREIVVLFLVILQLIKDQLIMVEQQTYFGDITLAHK